MAMTEGNKLYQLTWCNLDGRTLLHVPVIWPKKNEIEESLPFIEDHLEENDIFARCDILRVVRDKAMALPPRRQLFLLNIAFEEGEDWDRFAELTPQTRMLDYARIPMHLCLTSQLT